MGNRANINVVDGNKCASVWLYTHWNGDQLPMLLATALLRHKHWDEGPYLTRIIFETMLVVTNSLGTESGFGISAECGDGSDRVLLVSVESQLVIINGDAVSRSWTFEEYIALSAGDLARLW